MCSGCEWYKKVVHEGRYLVRVGHHGNEQIDQEDVRNNEIHDEQHEHEIRRPVVALREVLSQALRVRLELFHKRVADGVENGLDKNSHDAP